MENFAMYRTVLAELSNYGVGTVFGGYVRDMVSGEASRDMDVFVRQNEGLRLHEALRAVCYVNRLSMRFPGKDKNNPGYGRSVDVETIVLTSTEASIQLDIVTPNYPHASFLQDVNVNHLALTPSGMMYVFATELMGEGLRPAHDGASLLVEALLCIQKKEFIPLGEPHRIKKMIEKGWKAV